MMVPVGLRIALLLAVLAGCATAPEPPAPPPVAAPAPVPGPAPQEVGRAHV